MFNKVKVSTVLPASKDEIFELLLQTKTLEFVAHGKVEFDTLPPIWEVGKPVLTRVRQIGHTEWDEHTVIFKTIDKSHGLLETEEYGDKFKWWNHTMTVKDVGNNRCRYTDVVEFSAGLLTPIAWFLVNDYYQHRHDRWLMWLKYPKTT